MHPHIKIYIIIKIKQTKLSPKRVIVKSQFYRKGHHNELVKIDRGKVGKRSRHLVLC
jgi:hypothetical protein